jgi:uncharacterized membrane protein HdeD (DUF308 family)
LHDAFPRIQIRRTPTAKKWFAWKAVGILTVIWIIGIYALLAGILLIVTGFRVKTHPWRRLAS